MTGQRWVFAGIAAILLTGSGCMSCGHRGYDLARLAGTSCELPACQRNQIHVFAMSGLNPISIMALDGLAEELHRQGFAKVATGQTIHFGWMAREMRRIRDVEPDAQFVIVGFESAGPIAVRLAERLSREGLPINGVVVIDSEGKTAAPISGIRTLAIGNVQGMLSLQTVDSVDVPDAASYGLATDSRTVNAVGRLLTDLASTVPIPVVQEVTEWEYPHAPPMRPEVDPSRYAEWMFLFDQPYAARRPTMPQASPATVQPASAPIRSAIR